MTIDLVIVIVYLAFVLLVGLYFGKGTRTVQDFSVAPRSYPVPIVVATIFATIVDGSSTMGSATAVFTLGIVFAISMFGEVVREFIHGFIIVERIRKFKDAISTGDIVGNFYGKFGRATTGVFATLVCVATVGTQCMAIGLLLHRFFAMPFSLGVLVGSSIVIIYSFRGGIKAVTTTDVLQFAVLIIGIPLLCNAAMARVGGFSGLVASLPASHMSFFPDKGNLTNCIGIFFVFAIPGLHPAVVQRMMMGKEPREAKKSFIFAGLIYIPFYAMTTLLGLAALSLSPSIEPNLALPYLIDTILPIGIRGLLIAGLIAVIMSTTDSFMNVGAITIVRDIIKPFRKREMTDKLELRLMKATTLGIGLFGIATALLFKSIMGLVILAWGLWVATMSVPILLAIFGYKASKSTFICAMLVAVSVFAYWEIFLGADYGLGSSMPAMAANLAVFLVSLAKNKLRLSKDQMSEVQAGA